MRSMRWQRASESTMLTPLLKLLPVFVSRWCGGQEYRTAFRNVLIQLDKKGKANGL